MNKPIKDQDRWKGRGNEKGHRNEGIYIHPESKRPHISVTTIIDQTIAKPALLTYYAKKAAEALRANPTWEDAQLLGYIKDYSRAAMDRGSRVHSLAEAYLKGAPVHPLPDDEGYLAALEAWKEQHKVRVIETECTVYHDSGYAGTMDLLGTFGNDTAPRIVDLKTGSGLYQEYLFQASAYRAAIEDEGIRTAGVQVVLLRPDGTFRTMGATPGEADNYFTGFMGAKSIYEIRNQKKLTEIGYLTTEGGED